MTHIEIFRPFQEDNDHHHEVGHLSDSHMLRDHPGQGRDEEEPKKGKKKKGGGNKTVAVDAVDDDEEDDEDDDHDEEREEMRRYQDGVCIHPLPFFLVKTVKPSWFSSENCKNPPNSALLGTQSAIFLQFLDIYHA